MAKIVYRQLPTPIPTNPHPPGKGRIQKPRVRANFWCKSPGVHEGGWLWMKLIIEIHNNAEINQLALTDLIKRFIAIMTGFIAYLSNYCFIDICFVQLQYLNQCPDKNQPGKKIEK